VSTVRVEASGTGRGPIPWATLAVAVLAGAMLLWPGAARAAVFDRARLEAGEWWRLWTGQFVHFGIGHLAWNLAVVLPAGIWAERIAPWRTRGFFLFAPAAIGGILFAFDPLLYRYAGLSGLVAGVVTLLAMTQLTRPQPDDRWFWRAVLGLLGAKIIYEALAARAIFVRFDEATIQPVPLAHLAGVFCGLAAHRIGRRRAARWARK
jgi:rhomboid family GlyGly-CTERM serine protease